MIDYYEILELDENCSKKDIKQNYKKLCLKYHPDKNKEIDSNKFIKLKEAYDILIDDNKRNIYDYQRRFYFLKDFDLSDYEISYLNTLYEKINNSYEIKFCKILFNTLPKEFHEKLNILKKNIFTSKNTEIIKSDKYINIENLEENFTIFLNLSLQDVYNMKLKKIIIQSKTNIFYIFIRTFNDIKLINGNYIFHIKFIVKDNNYKIKQNNLLYLRDINIYELLFKKEYEIILPNNQKVSFKKNNSNIYSIKGLGICNNYDYKNRGNLYVIFNLNYSKDYSLNESVIKEIFDK
tara:strand:+ start:248 stop:1126 length:879 start_codon:yes stop_codon:yes gene_type:complete